MYSVLKVQIRKWLPLSYDKHHLWRKNGLTTPFNEFSLFFKYHPMNKMRYFLLFVVLNLTMNISHGHDTIRVMQYNLMFYGVYTDFCNADNNNISDKDEYLRTILGHVTPDILAVNELGGGTQTLNRLRDSVLNVDGVDYFEHASFTGSENAWFANGFFYDSRKFGLYEEAVTNSTLRDINLYTLYYKSAALPQTGDTTFLTFMVAHLKAGQSSNDQQLRTAMVSNAMSYLDNHNYSGNLFFAGDFNMRSSYEQAYQLMVNHSNPHIRFYDPIDVPGVWGLNEDMAPYHTQSPRSGEHPCFVTGGLDDRYDFILVSEPVMKGSNGLQYIEDSYYALGQDGNRFNQSLVNPPNDSQPPEVISALYNMSDHLPVVMDMLVTKSVDVQDFPGIMDDAVSYSNPVNEKLVIDLAALTQNGNVRFSLYSMDGKKLLWDNYLVGDHSSKIKADLSILVSGTYIFQLEFADGSYLSRKIIKR